MNVHPVSICAFAAVAVALSVSLPLRTLGQGGADAAAEEAATARMLVEIVAQQTSISENNAAIDAAIVEVTERVRQARLFVARGGGAAK